MDSFRLHVKVRSLVFVFAGGVRPPAGGSTALNNMQVSRRRYRRSVSYMIAVISVVSGHVEPLLTASALLFVCSAREELSAATLRIGTSTVEKRPR